MPYFALLPARYRRAQSTVVRRALVYASRPDAPLRACGVPEENCGTGRVPTMMESNLKACE